MNVKAQQTLASKLSTKQALRTGERNDRTSESSGTTSAWLAAAKNIACATLWITLSAAVILYNKYILTEHGSHGNSGSKGFPFPITLTMWHMLFSGLLATAMIKMGLVESANIEPSTYAKGVLPIASLFAGTLWLGNTAYMYLSVSFIQMLKALMPAAVFFVGCLLRTETFSWSQAGNMAVITAGVAIASAGEVTLVFWGVLFQMGSIVSESVRLTLVQILLQRRGLKLNPVTTLYYVAPASFVCLALPWSILEAPALLDVMQYGTVRYSWLIFFSNATVAFSLNLSVFLLIGRTSALTMNVAGVIKDWLLIGLSTALFKSPVTTLNLFGYLIAFTGVCWYNYAKANAAR